MPVQLLKELIRFLDAIESRGENIARVVDDFFPTAISSYPDFGKAPIDGFARIRSVGIRRRQRIGDIQRARARQRLKFRRRHEPGDSRRRNRL